jgi:hypothetical protein
MKLAITIALSDAATLCQSNALPSLVLVIERTKQRPSRRRIGVQTHREVP